MTKKDITTGMKFGRLTAIKELDERLRNEIAWQCRCECGNETTATKSSLLSGRKKSCGCLKKRTPANALDLKGKKFGKLTVIERSGTTKNGNALWLCKCDCGNMTKANATSLRRNEIVSCGCLAKQQINKAKEVLMTNKTIDCVQVPYLTQKTRSDSQSGVKGVYKRVRNGNVTYEPSISIKGKRKYLGVYKNLKDAIRARKEAEKEYHAPYIKKLNKKEGTNSKMNLIGEKYGRLSVVKELEAHGKSRRFLCKCDCGNETVVRMTSLRSGNTQSCGCLKSERTSQAHVIDLTGKKYGKLTVIKKVNKETDLLTSFWLCECECSKQTIVSSNNLRSGHTKSCGCLRKVGASKKDLTRESCLNDMINIYKKHGKINQHKLNSKLPGYSLMTLRRRFGGIKVDKIWEIVENEILEEKQNGKKD